MTHKIIWEYDIRRNFPIQLPMPHPMWIKKKEKLHLADLTIQIDHRVKMKESEKIKKYSDFVREI